MHMSDYFSVDWDAMNAQIFSMASAVLTFMMPVVGLSAGFGLGFGLVDKITRLFSKAI
jgi:hypothetical protein